MSNGTPWGLYICLFLLFVGLSAGGLIVASAGSVFHIEDYEKIALPAIATSLSCILVAGALVYSDDPAVAGMIATSVEFMRLFIGPPRPAADPWETANDPYNDKKVGYGRAAVAMQQLLAAEGLELGGENNQFEDHMGIELLYLSALCGKTAAGFAEGDEAVRSVANKAAWFIKAHPLFWMQRFRANVDAERPEGYYSAFLEYVDGVLDDHYDTLV